MAKKPPSYHDLFITTKDMKRTSIFNLPFNLQVICTRVGGWELWSYPHTKDERLLAGEYDDKPLRLDVNGVVIVDNLTEYEQREQHLADSRDNSLRETPE